MHKLTRSPISVPIESDALRSDVAHAFAIVAERARQLETTGRSVFDGVIDAAFDGRGDELQDRAARVRCSARYVVSLAAELEAMAGRLDGIALTRQLIEQALDGGEAPNTTSERTRASRQR